MVRYNPATGASLGTFVSPGSGGLSSTADSTIRFGPDGNLYVIGNNLGRGLVPYLNRYRGDTGAYGYEGPQRQ